MKENIKNLKLLLSKFESTSKISSKVNENLISLTMLNLRSMTKVEDLGDSVKISISLIGTKNSLNFNFKKTTIKSLKDFFNSIPS